MTNLIQNIKIPMYIFVAKSIMHNFSSTFKLVVCNITHCFEPEYIILVHLCLWNKRQTCEKMFKNFYSTQSVFKGLIFQSCDVFGICTARNYMTSNMRINTIKVQYFYITVTVWWEGGGTWNQPVNTAATMWAYYGIPEDIRVKKREVTIVAFRGMAWYQPLCPVRCQPDGIRHNLCSVFRRHFS